MCKRNIFLMLVFLLVSTGCQLFVDETPLESGFHVPDKFSYAWKPIPQSAIDRMSAAERRDIVSGFDSALYNRGCVVKPEDEAAYLVVLHYSSTGKMSMVDTMDGYGTLPQRTDFTDEEELFVGGIPNRMMVIDLVDVKTNNIVWRGHTRVPVLAASARSSAFLLGASMPNSEFFTLPDIDYQKYASRIKMPDMPDLHFNDFF